MTRHMSTDEYRRRRLELMSEDELLRAVVKLAHANGWLVHHQRPGRDSKGWRSQIIGDKGFPDLVVARDGYVLFIELKSEKGKVRPDEWKWIDALSGDIRTAIVFRPHDWPAIVEILK